MPEQQALTGTVVVFRDLVAGTVITAALGRVWVLTKRGFIRIVPISDVFPYQDGMTLEEGNDVGSTSQAAPSRRGTP